MRRATAADETAIFELIRQAYPGREQYKIPARWNWQFRQNPFRQHESLPIWIALDGPRVVGQTCALIEPMLVQQRPLRVGWSVDTVVLPEYRGRGLGKRLQQSNQESHELFMSLKMSPANARIKARLGGRSLPPLQLLELSLGWPAAALQERVARRSAWLGRWGGRLGAWQAAAGLGRRSAQLRWDRRRRTCEPLQPELELTPVARFPDEVDCIGQALARRFDLLVCRQARYLNWKFVDQPHVEYVRFLARQAGELVGYLVLRECRDPEPELGLIVELCALPDRPQLTAALAVLAVEYFRQRNVPRVKAATSCAACEAVYRRLGFQPVRSLTPMFHTADPRLRQWPQEGAAPATFFDYGDHDLDQFPLGR